MTAPLPGEILTAVLRPGAHTGLAMVVATSGIDYAFRRVKREHFLLSEFRYAADVDAPLPIGFGQTNSQPSTVYRMLEWLDPQPGDRVLDVGSGSGWTTGLLGCLVGMSGKVYAVEKIPELAAFGAENCLRAGIVNAEFFEASDTIGLPQSAPYDRILVSAAARRVPEGLLEQLKIGGRMVVPVEDKVLIIQKNNKASFSTIEHPGYTFVPLT